MNESSKNIIDLATVMISAVCCALLSCQITLFSHKGNTIFRNRKFLLKL
ncbi:hypothetical protein Bache_0892 [Bacteroides helcogenes P 36-108]|uniref:Lipoprotein n=1 Tax=Bacteroides helcogenes (strain ATCC 35417 / DSM 20613 / JCM 6297 / CCUG 15421 / P 36-108) TaxID=693979 RepID=E6SQ04_BACT6|nr:hypothetical protein Bache_0892 [Bacteroides helcogenes P 36-108]